jgi:hypothetical protein
MKHYLISILTIASVYVINAYVALAQDTGNNPAGNTGGSKSSGGGASTTIQIQNPLGGTTTVAEFINKIFGFFVQLGAVVLVLAIVYSGFLFVVAQGNPEKLKKAKEAFKWTVIGGAILLGAQVIAQVIETTLKDLAA